MFKIGSYYSRKDVGFVLHPKEGRPAGGNWDTGYVTVEDKLIVFMNMGVPGKTGHNYNNSYDDEKKEITWYGKTKSHSGTDIFKKLFSGELTPHYFARWEPKDPNFVYLGVGVVSSFRDNVPCEDGQGKPSFAIELKLKIKNSDEVLKEIIPKDAQALSKFEPSANRKQTEYGKEKDLEKFLIRNWGEVETQDISKGWDLVPNPATGKPGQNFAGSGPLDILAINKDKTKYRVIELKKGAAPDKVVAQILRYMGWIKNNILKNGQTVEGIIIAYEDDQIIRNALEFVPEVRFLKYRKFQISE
jgi:hypothetical protein|tara:strand:- start:104 stop:1009 length:906 start_codon:yes stop_codon:yes gene_type:complete